MPNFRPSFLYASPASYGESVLSLGLFHLKECTVKAVLADVEISDIFQRTTVLKDVAFIGFKAENARNLLSDPVTCDLSPDLWNKADYQEIHHSGWTGCGFGE